MSWRCLYGRTVAAVPFPFNTTAALTTSKLRFLCCTSNFEGLFYFNQQWVVQVQNAKHAPFSTGTLCKVYTFRRFNYYSCRVKVRASTQVGYGLNRGGSMILFLSFDKYNIINSSPEEILSAQTPGGAFGDFEAWCLGSKTWYWHAKYLTIIVRGLASSAFSCRAVDSLPKNVFFCCGP